VNSLRTSLDLSGLWDFAVDDQDVGLAAGWAARGPPPALRRTIAVPGSWGEQHPELRDYLGAAWYFRRVQLPRWMTSGSPAPRLLLRVGAATYACAIFVNGELLGVHEGPGLPFQVDCSSVAARDSELFVALRVEGRLLPTRVPPGELAQRPQQMPNVGYDFFPWAGVHREVCLLALPGAHAIEDVTTRTELPGDGSASFFADVRASGGFTGPGLARLVSSEDGRVCAEQPLSFSAGAASATLHVPSARLWSPASPSLYQLQLTLGGADSETDRYDLSVGLRTVNVSGDALLLNGAPLQLRGFGKHEDTPLRGRGYCAAAAVRDASSIGWCGGNSYRTAHYPHHEESLALADRTGLAVISETPAVYLCFHDGEENVAAREAATRRILTELVARDKNRACVLLWSLANEPEANVHLDKHGCSVPPAEDKSWEASGLAFFSRLFALGRELDPTRPLTYAAHPFNPMSWVACCDVVCTNRYNGWYSAPGDIAGGVASLGRSLDREHAELRRPFILSEFGADAIAGTHSCDPPEMWSEEYQVEMIRAFLDLGNTRPWLIGFHVWNLCDFKTTQAIRRPQGLNHKGVFTRDRRPKQAAHFLRQRWTPALLDERARAEQKD
jgi:beta-glucuronidase